MDYNTVAGMQIAVPGSRPHVTITHVSVDVTTARENLDPSFCCGNQYSFFWLVAAGQTVFEQEMSGWSQAIDRDTPASRDLQAAIYCSFGNGPQPCHWEGGTGPLIGISQLRLTLQESDPPTAQATGGTLLSGGTVRGTQTLSYTATDADSGIRDVAVQIGTATVGTDTYGDRCANDDWNACPLREDRGDMPIDTSRVPDGTYPLTFAVTDAAGNTATVDSGRTVTINNAHANGTGAVGKNTNVRLVLGQGQTRALRMVFGHKLVITGQALDSDGKPVPDATVDVASQLGGQAFTDIGQAHTNANGAFAFPVPPRPQSDPAVLLQLTGQRRSAGRNPSRRRPASPGHRPPEGQRPPGRRRPPRDLPRPARRRPHPGRRGADRIPRPGRQTRAQVRRHPNRRPRTLPPHLQDAGRRTAQGHLPDLGAHRRRRRHLPLPTRPQQPRPRHRPALSKNTR